VPHESDDPIAASPLPGPSPAVINHRSASPMGAPIKLKGKSRGVRAQDIPFELTDRAGIASGGAIVAIPVGEERGEIASLPSAQIHESAKVRFGAASGSPGQSSGYGELQGHDKSGKIGFYGSVKADVYSEGSLSGASGGKGGKVVAGKGFEIGGPVGDRRITHRKLPEYPQWAEEKGISAIVKIYFTVRPDGTIRSTMRILQSSGYAELDDLAKDALKQWRFSETSADSSESAAWGEITFRFTLA
jgi:TonB family protein